MKNIKWILLGLSMPIIGWAQGLQVTEGSQPVTLYEIENADIQSALLFYRIEGSRHFLQQPLLRQDNTWSSTFGGNQLRAPGLEYYIQLTFKDGQKK